VFFFVSLLFTIYYREKQELDPNTILAMFAFSPLSSNSSLRKHLEREHEEQYIEVCTANGWKIQLPKWLERERNQSRIISEDATREPFTDDTFIRKVINWVIADDQAS
jgi:hypothetical protein